MLQLQRLWVLWWATCPPFLFLICIFTRKFKSLTSLSTQYCTVDDPRNFLLITLRFTFIVIVYIFVDFREF